MPAITADELKKQWGVTLATARRDQDRTQIDLSIATGLDQTTISKAERGVGSLEVFLTMAAELDINLLSTVL